MNINDRVSFKQIAAAIISVKGSIVIFIYAKTTVLQMSLVSD